MTNEEYTANHKKAFRAAFDLLNSLWPPEKSVEYFKEKAYPACAVMVEDMKKEGNALGVEFAKDIYWYLGDVAKEKEHEGT